MPTLAGQTLLSRLDRGVLRLRSSSDDRHDSRLPAALHQNRRLHRRPAPSRLPRMRTCPRQQSGLGSHVPPFPLRFNIGQRRTSSSPSAPGKANVARFNPHSIADSWHIFRCEEAADGNHTIRQLLCTTATCAPDSCKELPLRPEFDENHVRSTRPVYHGECLSNGAGTNSSWAYACGVPVDHTYLKHKAIADAAWARVRAHERGESITEL